MKWTAALTLILVCSCDQGAPAAKKPVEIKNGIRMTYSIAEGSPEQAAIVMQKRIDSAKATALARAEGREILVDVAPSDPEALQRLRDLIARVGRFEVKVVDDGSDVMLRLAATVHGEAASAGILEQSERWHAAGREHVDVYLTAQDRRESVPIADAKALGCLRSAQVETGNVECLVTGRRLLDRYLVDTALLDNVKIPDDHVVLYEHVALQSDATAIPYWRTYYAKRASALGPEAIASAKPSVDPDTNLPRIEVTLRGDAAKTFGDVTRANVGRKFAVLIDDRVESAPIVMSAITGGRVVITMPSGTNDLDAAQLARTLASGPLPGPVVLETMFELKDGTVVPPPAP